MLVLFCVLLQSFRLTQTIELTVGITYDDYIGWTSSSADDILIENGTIYPKYHGPFDENYNGGSVSFFYNPITVQNYGHVRINFSVIFGCDVEPYTDDIDMLWGNDYFRTYYWVDTYNNDYTLNEYPYIVSEYKHVDDNDHGSYNSNYSYIINEFNESRLLQPEFCNKTELNGIADSYTWIIHDSFVSPWPLRADDVRNFGFVGRYDHDNNFTKFWAITNIIYELIHIATEHPTNDPTVIPTEIPTIDPTEQPTYNPSNIPSKYPTNIPTKQPTINPTNQPTMSTATPTYNPITHTPTFNPITHTPTIIPTFNPTFQPTILPSLITTTLTEEQSLILSTEYIEDSKNNETHINQVQIVLLIVFGVIIFIVIIIFIWKKWKDRGKSSLHRIQIEMNAIGNGNDINVTESNHKSIPSDSEQLLKADVIQQIHQEDEKQDNKSVPGDNNTPL